MRQFQRTVQVPWLVGCLLFISGFLSPANAQIMRIVNGVAQAEGTPQQGLLTIDEAVQNALTDFDRHAQRGDFQKAFRVLENLPLEKRVGMLPAGNGFMSPARVRFWRLLVEMNAEGRAAFRLFYEPKAKQLTERMKTELAADRTKALATASEIYEQYFITSYGDDAAEILGDASFEKGDFVEAASRWRSIIDYHAETNLSLPKVMAKCAAAYVGAGRLTDARIVLSDVQRRFPSDKVRIAGKDQVVADYISSLLGSKTEQPQVAAVEQKLELPAQLTYPYWQMSFMSKKGQAAMTAAVSQNYYYKSGLETMIPNHVADQERVYLNWMGVVFAIDVASGKLAWRNDAFEKVYPHLATMQQGRVSPTSYGIQIAGERVLASAVPLDRLNYWQPAVPITAYNAKTGEKAWSIGGDQGGQQSFLGQMYPYKDGVLTVSHTQHQTNMQLNFLNLANGTSQWTMPLGTMHAQQNPYSGGQTFPSPDFGEVGRTLCMMNNSGAVLQINPEEKKVEGQFVMYEPKQTTDGSYYYYNDGSLPEEKRLHTRGRMLVRDGYLIFKEVGKSELFCVDVQSQKVLWKRPISSTAMVVEADDEHVYTMNTELSAYSRVDGKLKWSVRLPVAGGGLSIVLSGDSAYAATQRGIFEVNRHTGKVLRVVRTAETNSPGMGMRLIGDKLVTISSNSVTCYLLKPTADAPSK